MAQMFTSPEFGRANGLGLRVARLHHCFKVVLRVVDDISGGCKEGCLPVVQTVSKPALICELLENIVFLLQQHCHEVNYLSVAGAQIERKAALQVYAPIAGLRPQ